MNLLSPLALYTPDKRLDKKEEATHLVEEFFDTLTCLADLESRYFADWVAKWGSSYNAIGAADITCRESVYTAAERYLSLKELLWRIALSLKDKRNSPLLESMETVKGYFNLND
jgi:hypothetical protein